MFHGVSCFRLKFRTTLLARSRLLHEMRDKLMIWMMKRWFLASWKLTFLEYYFDVHGLMLFVRPPLSNAYIRGRMRVPIYIFSGKGYFGAFVSERSCCGSVDKTTDSQSWGPRFESAGSGSIAVGQGTLSSLPSLSERTVGPLVACL